jgi:hypothetical protein
MTIRIDALNPTAIPSRDHEVPAMDDGQTVKLTVAQMLALIQTGDMSFLGTGANQIPQRDADGHLPMGAKRLTGLGAPTAGTDGLSRDAGDARFTQRSNNLSDVAAPATARVNLGAAPVPTASSGVGEWRLVSAGANVALVLPSGGTWAYFALTVNNSTGVLNAPIVAIGVAAGGTTAIAANASLRYDGLAWRIA